MTSQYVRHTSPSLKAVHFHSNQLHKSMPKKKKKDKGKKKGKGGDGGASEKEENKDFEVPGSSEKEVELKRECVMIVCL